MPSRVRPTLLLFLFCCIIFSLVSGGLLHAVIPHNDHAHEYLWQSLHGGLQHEEKKMLLVVLASIFVAFLFFAERDTVPLRRFAYAPAPVLPPLSEALRRGVLSYRRFD